MMNEKDHKADFSFITRMLEENRKAGYEHGYSVGYNKAVDDTIKAIKEEYAFTILEEEKIDEIAEQLKGAKRNEDFKQEEIQQTH
jgi:hypothetical protein|nr:MAG TPA: hypothetical protein [Caudoviricetes sp.]